MESISIPVDCITYVDTGIGVKKKSADKVKVDKSRRLPNHWKWKNKKEYQAWWYKQNREVYKNEVLRKYHLKKKLNI